MEMLEKDLQIINSFSPMSEEEKEILFRNAPELGSYVCRLDYLDVYQLHGVSQVLSLLWTDSLSAP